MGELAIEFSPLVRVNCVAPATVVQGSTMFPRDRVISSLKQYQVPFSEEESTEALVSKLSRFYADRSNISSPRTPVLRDSNLEFAIFRCEVRSLASSDHR